MHFIIMGRKLTGLLLSLLAIVFVLPLSGCVMPGGTSGGSGVIIENFEADFSRVYTGEKFQLQTKIRNTGSVDAESVKLILYNIEKSQGISKLQISCDYTCPVEMSLLAPDPDRGTTGESKTCIWRCTAPQGIQKGLSVIFNPSMRMYYSYRTSTIKSINIASQNELKSIETRGSALPSETTSTTSGPVQLDVVINGPIRYWEEESIVKFPFNINILNSGGGVACSYATGSYGCEDEKNWNKVEISLENDPDIQIEDCELANGASTVIDLWKGQTKTITCELALNVGENAGIVQKNLKVDISYDYMTDASTTVEVVGRN